MSASRIKFSQPFWEYVFPLLSFLTLLPFLVFDSNYLTEWESSWPFDQHLILSPFFNYVFISLCLSLLAWRTNSIVNRYFLSNKDNFFPSLLVVLYGSGAFLALGVPANLLVLVSFLFAMNSMLYVNRDVLSQHYIFNSGFFSGCLLVLNSEFWFFVLVLLALLIIQRGFILKDIAVYIVGIVNCWLLKVGAEYLLFDRWDLGFNYHFKEVLLQKISLIQITLCGSFVLLFLAGLAPIGNYLKSSSNKAKSKSQLFVFSYLLLWLICVFVLTIKPLPFLILLLLPAVSVLGMIAIDKLKHLVFKSILVLIHLIILLSWLANIYF